MNTHTRIRVPALGVLLLLVVSLLAGLSASVANAATASPTQTSGPSEDTDTAYAYWSFWTGGATGDWTIGQAGAGSSVPADGTSQGWRYGVGSLPGLTEKPRVAVDFAAVCSGTPAASGRKRVAVVVDSGTSTEAPAGQTPPQTQVSCASVATSANDLQTLSSVTSVRQAPDTMVCGIGGYPKSGCGQQVSLLQLQGALASESAAPNGSTATTNAPAETKTANWVPLVFGAVVLAALVGLGMMISRRRRG